MIPIRCLVSSDWHIRSDKPRCRVDDWYTAQLERIRWVVQQINKYKCPMFVPGDILNSGATNQEIENMLIAELKKAEFPIYAIPGNHDLPYHSMNQLHKSTYWVLVQAGVLQDVTGNVLDGVTGVPYGQPIPTGKGILLCHTAVYPHEPPPYMIHAESAEDMLNAHDYELILSGHIHMPFTTQVGNKTLINAGGILRQEADEKYAQRMLYLYDNGSIEAIPCPMQVDDVEQGYLLDEKAKKERSNAFVERIKVSEGIGLSFKANVRTTLENMEVSKEVEELLFKAIDGKLVQ